MVYRTRLTLKVVFFVPLILSLTILAFIITGYAKGLGDDLNSEYNNITRNLEHSVKLLSGMNYSFSLYFSDEENHQVISQHHVQKIGEDGLCEWSPSQRQIQSAYRADARKVLQLDYAAKGYVQACNPESELYKDIESKLVLAPNFSFINGIENYILGLYYISPKGYLIASPAYLIEDMHQDAVGIVQQREYWQEAQSGISALRINGPVKDISTGKNILIISAGLFDENEFRGVVVLDVLVSKLYSEGSAVGERVKFLNLTNATLPANAWMPSTIRIDGVKTNQLMYFNWQWSHELHSFLVNRMASLLMLFILYVVMVIALLYIKITSEKRHFKDLSQRDPLTSLLNRRGFEVAYKSFEQQKYEGLAIFDIDDFKKINDAYGHDVGDDVICAVANCLNRNTRATDVVARFGGEEFVVYMQGVNADKMIEAIQRIQTEIGLSATKVIEQGYTISAGFTIRLTSDNTSLEDLIKDADNKLYSAKNSGKNKVVI
ncbi:diguanylate cyclase [Vibrio rumoiensis]|uniref:sensor domain-containing diguanylate cyclase n=1 Tax=Vibrio rumoiensis TaxID=76258 RepID=UPI000B5C95EE|nr:sensor domain-containing diguanylate cyclase [Vibrio rumoiensis]